MRCSDLDKSRHSPPFSMAGLPKNGIRDPIAGGGRDRHNLHRVCHTTVTAPPRVGCVF